jgi:signal transduction histidine kinase
VARPWRLRHKLTLLLALVLAAVGLLLAGSVLGLAGYRSTVDATRDKTADLQIVQQLHAAVSWVVTGPPDLKPDDREAPLDFERRRAQAAINLSHAVVAGYRQTVAARGPADPGDEADQLTAVEASLGRLARLIDQPDRRSGGLLGPDTPARAEHDRLNGLVAGLHGYLIADIQQAIARAKSGHDRSLAVAGVATVGAIVLVAALLYYFGVWVFAPIRRLQAGVRRVRAGDFDQPIRLESDDELAELGAEFDAMTARLKDITAGLQQQVSERTRQLVRSEKMVSVGFLAAGVAHEINNPLASIAFCAESLDDRLKALHGKAPAGEAEVVFKYLGMMQEEAQRCKEITGKLLDFSRGGGRREPADLAQIVRDVVTMTELMPTAHGKPIRFTGPPLTAVVSGPEIKSVVLNVVVNALDSMDPGGRLDIRLAERDGQAELTFADTGCGMAADTLKNIFEPFFTRSRTGQGTGLGLSISHQIVAQHGGTVTAASGGVGKGSTFTVRLPLRADDPPATLPFPAAARVAA